MMKSNSVELAGQMPVAYIKRMLGRVATGCLILDQAVKYVVRTTMTPGQSIPVVPDVFHITYVHNTGVAFSLFQQHPAWLLALTSVLFTVFLMFAFRRPGYTALEFTGFAMVLGGAAGNIVDRILFGKVIDYLDVTVIQYPVFNLADSFICVGVALLLLHYWRGGHHDGGSHDTV